MKNRDSRTSSRSRGYGKSPRSIPFVSGLAFRATASLRRDGSSDIHVMLHVIVERASPSPPPKRAHRANRQPHGDHDDALSVLIPVLEEIGGYDASQIAWCRGAGTAHSGVDRVRTDWLTSGMERDCGGG